MKTTFHKWLNKPPLGYGLDLGHPLVPGLVGCWLFNEGTGTKAYDLSGYANSGAGTDISWSADTLGTVASFNGTTSLFDLGTPSALNISGPMSVVARVLTTDVANGSTRSICSNCNSGGSAFQWLFRLNGAGAGLLDFSWGNGLIVSGTIPLTASVFYTVAGVRRGTSGSWRGTTYVNGKQDGTTTTADNPSAQFGTAIGRVGALAAQYWKGLISYVLLYNRALSASEVASFSYDPFQMLLAPTYRRWFTPLAQPSQPGPSKQYVRQGVSPGTGVRAGTGNPLFARG